MKRGLVQFATVISGVLLIATLGFWVESCFYDDLWSWENGMTYVSVQSNKGSLVMSATENRSLVHPASGSSGWNFFGIAWYGDELMLRDPSHHWPNNIGLTRALANAGVGSRLQVPYFWLAMLLLPLPSLWAWRIVRRKLVEFNLRLNGNSGRCLKCGYDLRASKERCPECGTAIPVTKQRESGHGLGE